MLSLRRLLIWSHVVVAAPAFIFYISHVDLTRFRWWAPNAGFRLVMIGSPSYLPFLFAGAYVSQLYTWENSGPTRLRAAAYVAVLIAGAALALAAAIGVFGPVDVWTRVELFAIQGGAYLWCAEWLLNVI